MWQYALTVIALLLVLEGIMPSVSPRSWRTMMLKILQMNDRTVRMIGLFSMALGALIMYLMHSGLLFD